VPFLGLTFGPSFPGWIFPIAGIWIVLVGSLVALETGLQGLRMARWMLSRRRQRRARRVLERLPLQAGLDHWADGARIRLCGIVQQDGRFNARFSGSPAVVARSAVVGRHGQPLATDEAAAPFRLRTPSGEIVEIRWQDEVHTSSSVASDASEQNAAGSVAAAAQARSSVLARWARRSSASVPGPNGNALQLLGGRLYLWVVDAFGSWRGGEIRERIVSPGDAIEVVGTMETLVSASGARAGRRSAPLLRILRGSAAQPLIVSAPETVVRCAGDRNLAAEITARKRALHPKALPEGAGTR